MRIGPFDQPKKGAHYGFSCSHHEGVEALSRYIRPYQGQRLNVTSRFDRTVQKVTSFFIRVCIHGKPFKSDCSIRSVRNVRSETHAGSWNGLAAMMLSAEERASIQALGLQSAQSDICVWQRNARCYHAFSLV